MTCERGETKNDSERARARGNPEGKGPETRWFLLGEPMRSTFWIRFHSDWGIHRRTVEETILGLGCPCFRQGEAVSPSMFYCPPVCHPSVIRPFPSLFFPSLFFPFQGCLVGVGLGWGFGLGWVSASKKESLSIVVSGSFVASRLVSGNTVRVVFSYARHRHQAPPTRYISTFSTTSGNRRTTCMYDSLRHGTTVVRRLFVVTVRPKRCPRPSSEQVCQFHPLVAPIK